MTMDNPSIYSLESLNVKSDVKGVFSPMMKMFNKRGLLCVSGIAGRCCLFFLFVTAFQGCSSPHRSVYEQERAPSGRTKVFVIILDALKRKTLMESLESLPNFRAAIRGENEALPYVYYENVLVSIPSSSKPSNATLLTGVYPHKHGIYSTMWFDRKEEKTVTLSPYFQRRIIKILRRTDTDTLFDYARRSEKSVLAVATQIAKGVDDRDWIRQGLHLWSQAFCSNLFKHGMMIPDGAFLDRGTTRGLLGGHGYSRRDGLEGRWRTSGDLPDLTVVHYVGLDILTHYPYPFMVEGEWSIDRIQKWYLKEVLDPELGKIVAYLKKRGLYSHTIFFFTADHGQTRIREHVDEKAFSRRFFGRLRAAGDTGWLEGQNPVIMPGAGTKAIYVKNRLRSDWMSPPRLIEDIKPLVDAIAEDQVLREPLEGLLVAQYPEERREGLEETDAFRFLDIGAYRKAGQGNAAFLKSLDPLSILDVRVGPHLRAPFMFRRNYTRQSVPDLLLINRPGCSFTPDRGKYAHHGSIHEDDAFVSFVVSGPGIERFSDRPKKIRRRIDTVDLVPMAAYLANIAIDRPLDGRNRLLGVEGYE